VHPSDAGLDGVDAPLALQRSRDGRDQCLVAVVADAHRHPTVNIDTLDLLEKPVHEVLP
jgi:hypothetical protein